MARKWPSTTEPQMRKSTMQAVLRDSSKDLTSLFQPSSLLDAASTRTADRSDGAGFRRAEYPRHESAYDNDKNEGYPHEFGEGAEPLPQRCLLAARRYGRVYLHPPIDDEHEEERDQQAGYDAGEEQPSDRLLHDDAVDDENDAGRDQHAEGADRGDDSRWRASCRTRTGPSPGWRCLRTSRSWRGSIRTSP